MIRYIQRKLRALFLWHFRDDLRLAYQAGYQAGEEDVRDHIRQDAYAEGWHDGYRCGLAEAPEH